MDVESRIVYHGSFVAVLKPEIRTNGYAKDFGCGFYCTDFEKQARRWAICELIDNYNGSTYYEPSDWLASEYKRAS